MAYPWILNALITIYETFVRLSLFLPLRVPFSDMEIKYFVPHRNIMTINWINVYVAYSEKCLECSTCPVRVHYEYDDDSDCCDDMDSHCLWRYKSFSAVSFLCALVPCWKHISLRIFFSQHKPTFSTCTFYTVVTCWPLWKCIMMSPAEAGSSGYHLHIMPILWS